MSTFQSEELEKARTFAFALLGVGQLLIYMYVALAFRGDPGRPSTAMLLALGAAFLYMGALIVARPLRRRAAFAAAILIGVAFRVALFPIEPFLSDDYFRYLWDGLVQLRGINPYRYAPNDPALAGMIDDAVRSHVNHPWVPTIYPPFAQLGFAVAALLPGGWLALKGLWMACDIGIAALLYRLVPAQRRVQAWTVYWWSPLVIIEVAWNAHLDLLGALPLVAAIYLARGRGKTLGPAFALAAAASVKYFAAALLPAAAKRAHGKGSIRAVAAFAIAVALLYLPYAAAGSQLFAGLRAYAELWRFNDGLFRVLTWMVVSPTAAKAVAAAVVLAMVMQSVRNEWSLERSAFWVTGTILILSPTVHPWYLIWMVPLIAIRMSRAWVYLTCSVFLAYYGLGAYRAEGSWPEPWPLKLAIYAPFFALLLTDAWRSSWWQTAWRQLRPRSEPPA